MVKILKVNKNFIPCPVADGDELFRNGYFKFNITKMLEFIRENIEAFTLEEISVNDFFINFSSINESHMDSAEINQPLILAEISPGQYNLIDGNHRMEKARRLGITNLMAYRLNAEQHIRFLINKKAYLAYIEYWNAKLK